MPPVATGPIPIFRIPH